MSSEKQTARELHQAHAHERALDAHRKRRDQEIRDLERARCLRHVAPLEGTQIVDPTGFADAYVDFAGPVDGAA